MPDELADYDYLLPERLIARHPPARRDDARLLVVDRQAGSITHHGIRDLPELLNPGDCLVLNDTRVLKARLRGRRRLTGGKWEGLFLDTNAEGIWRLIGQTRGKLLPGEELVIPPVDCEEAHGELLLKLLEHEGDGVWKAVPVPSCDPFDALARFGTVPLPPYMEREQPSVQDLERYQTTYARHPGSVAAPTAGLHFTPELLASCRQRGISQAFVTLHVGIGTFRPIAVERLADHRMHREWCELPSVTAEQLVQTRTAGGRVVSVGTTSTRTLETVARTGAIRAWSGTTNLFIRPPYQFRGIDALLTNFHLPRSTLFVLVCTFAERELMHAAYAEAIRREYRFFSYGDAMLIV